MVHVTKKTYRTQRQHDYYQGRQNSLNVGSPTVQFCSPWPVFHTGHIHDVCKSVFVGNNQINFPFNNFAVLKPPNITDNNHCFYPILYSLCLGGL